MFGTRDDKALQAAVKLLAPGGTSWSALAGLLRSKRVKRLSYSGIRIRLAPREKSQAARPPYRRRR
jgi:hypothetical protein